MSDDSQPGWLDFVPSTSEAAIQGVQRLQRTIRVLIAIGLITSKKADEAYEIAGSC